MAGYLFMMIRWPAVARQQGGSGQRVTGGGPFLILDSFVRANIPSDPDNYSRCTDRVKFNVT